MKAKDLIYELSQVDPEAEVYRDEDRAVCTPVQMVTMECVRHAHGFGRNLRYEDDWIVILM